MQYIFHIFLIQIIVPKNLPDCFPTILSEYSDYVVQSYGIISQYAH